jgi:mono/diheme cytochrome c family protein
MLARLVGFAAICGLTLASVPADMPASAQGRNTERTAAAAASGEEFYQIACADCHGLDGRGAGPMAQFLTVKPSDLTTLSLRNGGVFPFRQVFDVVDGRTVVPPHGSRPGMPLWGAVFQDFARERFGPHGTESYVRGRLMELVLYLETIQQ